LGLPLRGRYVQLTLKLSRSRFRAKGKPQIAPGCRQGCAARAQLRAAVVQLAPSGEVISTTNYGFLHQCTDLLDPVLVEVNRFLNQSQLLLAIKNGVECSRHTYGQRIFLEGNFPIGT